MAGFNGWTVESIGCVKAVVRLTFNNLQETDHIDILFPGTLAEKLVVKVNGTAEMELTLDRLIDKLKCSKKVDGASGVIKLTLYKKKNQDAWPEKKDWTDNRSTPPL